MAHNLTATVRAWRRKNPDKVREYKKRHAAKHGDSIRAYRRAYYHKNKERILVWGKAWREKNHDVICAKIRARKARDPERFRLYARQHRQNNQASWLWSATKRRAKEYGLDFDLDKEWFQQRLTGGTCEMSGLPFKTSMAGRLSARGPDSASVDRIDPRGPYTKANCRLVLWWLNRALAHLGEEYTLKVFRAIFVKRGEMLASEKQEAA